MYIPILVMWEFIYAVQSFMLHQINSLFSCSFHEINIYIYSDNSLFSCSFHMMTMQTRGGQPFYMPRAIYIFITSFRGHSKLSPRFTGFWVPLWQGQSKLFCGPYCPWAHPWWRTITVKCSHVCVFTCILMLPVLQSWQSWIWRSLYIDPWLYTLQGCTLTTSSCFPIYILLPGTYL